MSGTVPHACVTGERMADRSHVHGLDQVRRDGEEWRELKLKSSIYAIVIINLQARTQPLPALPVFGVLVLVGCCLVQACDALVHYIQLFMVSKWRCPPSTEEGPTIW